MKFPTFEEFSRRRSEQIEDAIAEANADIAWKERVQGIKRGDVVPTVEELRFLHKGVRVRLAPWKV
jgi:hypothetical protein